MNILVYCLALLAVVTNSDASQASAKDYLRYREIQQRSEEASAKQNMAQAPAMTRGDRSLTERVKRCACECFCCVDRENDVYRCFVCRKEYVQCCGWRCTPKECAEGCCIAVLIGGTICCACTHVIGGIAAHGGCGTRYPWGGARCLFPEWWINFYKAFWAKS